MKFLLLLCSLLVATPALAQQTGLEEMQIAITTVSGSSHTFTVEIADTSEKRRIGLMDRWQISPDNGMLFVFRNKQVLHFWMKDTRVPLDMLFIDDTGRIVTLHDSAKPNDLTPVSSEEEVRWAIELPGGRAKQLGITPGSVVITPLPKLQTTN